MLIITVKYDSIVNMTIYSFIIGLIIALFIIGFMMNNTIPAAIAVALSAYCMLKPGVNYIQPNYIISTAFMLTCVFIMTNTNANILMRAISTPGVIVSMMFIAFTPTRLNWYLNIIYVIAFIIMELMVIHAVHVFNKTHEFELTDSSDINASMPAYHFTNRLTLITIIMTALLLAYRGFMLTPYYNKYLS